MLNYQNLTLKQIQLRTNEKYWWAECLYLIKDVNFLLEINTFFPLKISLQIITSVAS